MGSSIDTRISEIEDLLRQEREIGRINTLENLEISRGHRKSISEIWQAIQAELAPISQAIKDLPKLPEAGVIRWAQSVLAMGDLRFLEIDTTGLQDNDEIVRFTVMNAKEQVIQDLFIKPRTSQLSEQASQVNGLTVEWLEEVGVDIANVWDIMRLSLTGAFVISYNQEWDVKQLDAMAARYGLEPITVVGADLQRQATKYYSGEYYLNLFKVSERMGHTMPEPPTQTALHRCIAQIRVLEGMANAITDVRPPRSATPVSSPTTEGSENAYSLGGDDSLGDLDDHPF